MKKAIIMKSILLLCTLLAGVVSAHADDYDYEWVKVTNLADLQTNDVVLLVDEGMKIALPNNDNSFKGVSVTISDGKIADEGSANIQWTLTKNNDDTYTFTAGGKTLSFPQKFPNSLTFDDTSRSEFVYNSGLLGVEAGSNTLCVKWDTDNKAIFNLVNANNPPNSVNAEFTFYKKVEKLYVKWKRAGEGSFTVGKGEVIVVVDVATERALANDKADKDPDAVAVTLNDDKDRIAMEEVPEKLQWIFNRNKEQGAWLKTGEGKYLYADTDKDGNPVLRVGDVNDDNIYFHYGTTAPYYESLDIAKGEGDNQKIYLFSVDDSMFSNVWQLKVITDDFKENDLFYYKKVEDHQKVVKIEMAENYFVDISEDKTLNLNATCTGADFSDITWTTSDKNVATVTNGIVSVKKAGTVVITASVGETDYHDKASAKCTVRIEDVSSTDPGSVKNPLTVAQAKELAEKGKVTVNGTKIEWEEGMNYHIKGKVSKVNSGMLAMFGDMDFGELGGIGGGTGNGENGMNFDDMMDDMDFDMDSMSEMGFDMSSLGFDISAFLATSDGLTYFISDDGTKDNQLKVLNGYERMRYIQGEAVFDKDLDLSPGDDVVVCGPLVYSEDTNMLSSLMGSGDEPKKSWKVGEINYQTYQDMIIEVEDHEIYINNSLKLNELYNVDEDIVNGTMEEPTIKSSDEEIAKWDEEKKELVGVKVGTAKITVKIKVVVAAENGDNKEKAYTMKRKFKLTVKTRDVEPAGKYAGDYVLTTNTDDLVDGTRLVLVGTRVKEGKEDTDYIMGENNSFMGGGKSGSKIDNDKFVDNKTKIPCEDAPKGTLEVVLEQAEGGSWYLNVGKDENGNKLYLYASDKQDEGSGNNNSNPMMEMFMSNSGLKVATMDAATADSCKAKIDINTDGATIQYPMTAGKKTIIKLDSSFDMEEMMKMFSSTGEGEGQGEGQGSSSSFDMGDFDMFMAAFNTKKADDEKGFMPRIYRFVPDESFGIKVDESGWSSIVTYNDVTIPEDLEAYVVTKVKDAGTEKTAILKDVKGLKGGHPYLLHTENTGNFTNFTLTLSDAVAEPEENLLQVSDSKTTDGVYVLAKQDGVAAFYVWNGGLLGSGRVYLPAESGASLARILIDFYVEPAGIATGITEVKQSSDMKAYDLQGRRVSVTKGQVTKGLYIVNGKKVVVK